MKMLFYKTKDTVKAIFHGKNIVWQLIAMVLTAIFVLSGFDWYYYSITRSAFLRSLIFPAVIAGALLPIFVPLGLLLIGTILKEKKTIIIAWALGQAALYGLLLSDVYKSVTGRIPPVLASRSVEVAGDISRNFQFGFMRGGIFWGWPSSHTTIAFAMASAVYVLFPKEKLLYISGFMYALYVGLSISISIHWFSEFIAGIIFGTIVGLTVGKAFKQKLT